MRLGKSEPLAGPSSALPAPLNLGNYPQKHPLFLTLVFIKRNKNLHSHHTNFIYTIILVPHLPTNPIFYINTKQIFSCNACLSLYKLYILRLIFIFSRGRIECKDHNVYCINLIFHAQSIYKRLLFTKNGRVNIAFIFFPVEAAISFNGFILQYFQDRDRLYAGFPICKL